jgi:WD40 repeat protein
MNNSLRLSLLMLGVFSIWLAGCALGPTLSQRPEGRLETTSDSTVSQIQAKRLRTNHPELFNGVKGLLVAQGNGELQAGDILLTYANTALDSIRNLRHAIEAMPYGQQVQMGIIRVDVPLKISVSGGGLGVRLIELGDTGPTSTPLLRIELGKHSGAIESISVDKNEQFMLTVSRDKTMRLWDVKTGKLKHIYRVPSGPGPEGRLKAGTISPDARWVLGSGFTGWGWSGEATIYIFDRQTGTLARKISGLPATVQKLVFSKDGKYVAAALNRGMGVRVWSVEQDFKLSAQDDDYTSDTNGVDFSTNGTMVTTSNDGFVRLYDKKFKLIHKVPVPDGRLPHDAVFSPDGTKIAVGYREAANVSVLSSVDLHKIYQANSPGGSDRGNLSRVAWSHDGEYLYAGGVYPVGEQKQIWRWSEAGRGSADVWPINATGAGLVRSLQALSNGDLVYGSREPVLQTFDSNGRVRIDNAVQLADFRKYKKLRVSQDGSIVQFGLAKHDNGRARFDLKRRKLSLDVDPDDGVVKKARRKAPGLKVKRWRKKFLPELNGRQLTFDRDERSRAIAIAPNQQHFLLGMNKTLRLFDRDGNQLWSIRTPAYTWNVNISGDGKLGIAAYGDGTIRWYGLMDGKERLMLFPYDNGTKWIAWTPEGFFDASEGAENLIGFHVNRGPDKAAQFVGIEKMYDKFYRPDLVAKRLFQENNSDILQAANKLDIKEMLAGGLPPAIEIVSPAANATISNGVAAVVVCIKDQGGGIGKILYRLNGVTLGVDDSRAIVRNREQNKQDCTYRITRNMSLESGANNVSITAFNKDNNIESEPAAITASFNTTIIKKPNLYVIAMGINRYRDQALRLKYSVPDARSLGEQMKLTSAGLFKDIHVFNIFDESATIPKIKQQFFDVAAKVKPEDVFVFYAAAHGLAMDGQYFIIPQDLIFKNEDSVRKKAINQDMLQKWLSTIPAHKSLVLLDTCNSGAFLDVRSRGLAEKTAVDKLMRATGRVVIAASASNEEALEGYKGHGVFTYVLLDALAGSADKKGNNDGEISINELAEFIGDEVPRITMEKWGKEQFPMQYLKGRSFPIGLVN